MLVVGGALEPKSVNTPITTMAQKASVTRLPSAKTAINQRGKRRRGVGGEAGEYVMLVASKKKSVSRTMARHQGARPSVERYRRRLTKRYLQCQRQMSDSRTKTMHT